MPAGHERVSLLEINVLVLLPGGGVLCSATSLRRYRWRYESATVSVTVTSHVTVTDRRPLSSLPWNEGQPVRSFSVGARQSWRFQNAWRACSRQRSVYNVVEFMMSYGSAGAPRAREDVRTSCANLFRKRTLVRFAEAGAETKTYSNSHCLAVGPQRVC